MKTRKPRIRMLPPRIKTIDTRSVKPQPRQSAIADPFYLSQAWRELVARLKAERGARCENPSCETPDRGEGNVVADHIRERKDGGADLDPANVMLMCRTCHRRKTIAAAQARLRFGGDEVDWADERRRTATKGAKRKGKRKGEITWGVL